jgi:hypothetical protein
MSQSMRWTLLWLAGSTFAVIAALTLLTAAHIDNEFLPSNPDAFYHARRILDSLFSGEPVIQFDARIHVPEGSWLTWPWGFDTLMTALTRLFGPYANEAAANRVLMNIPPAAAPIAVGIVVLIARQLALPFFLAVIFVLAFAALPLVYMQFAVGNVDHHFAELLWTLGTVSAGMAFFRTDARPYRPGIVLGLVLGSALAIHNGLFILMLPVSMALALAWLRGLPMPDRRRSLAFAASLLLTTLLVCIPSEPWRRGFFEFYTLSWFHFYIAACVAIFALLLAFLRRSGRNVFIVVTAAVLAVLPIVGTLAFAGEFVSGQLASIQDITEARSPYALYREFGEEMSTRFISWLLWFSVPMVLLNLWWIVRRKDPALNFVSMAAVLGLCLMQTQFRFCVFGELFLLLTPIQVAHSLSQWRPQWRFGVQAACLALFAVCFYPTIANFQPRWTLGGNLGYANVRSTFPTLAKLCRERPGIVLGDLDTGHWVRYHSECSVIADVFLLTPQHAAKAFESARLLGLEPAQLLAQNQNVRYVFPHHTIVINRNEKGEETPILDQLRMQMRPLERVLMGPESGIPPQFKKRWEVRTPGGQVFARLYEIER